MCVSRGSGAIHESMSVHPMDVSSVATNGMISALSSSVLDSQSIFPALASAMSHACSFAMSCSVLSDASMYSAVSALFGILYATVIAIRCEIRKEPGCVPSMSISP